MRTVLIVTPLAAGFNSGSSALKSGYTPTLDKIARVLN